MVRNCALKALKTYFLNQFHVNATSLSKLQFLLFHMRDICIFSGALVIGLNWEGLETAGNM